MEWLWLPCLIGGLIVGFILGVKAQSSVMQQAARQMLRTQAIDRGNFLRVLRREIANHLMQQDSKGFERIYERLHDDVAGYASFSKDALVAERRALSERYPSYDDFDLLGTREHVLYPDAFGGDDERVVDHFKDIVRFQALNAILDENWKRQTATSDENLKDLREYAQEVLDSRLERKLIAAMRTYYAGRGDSLDGFETNDFTIEHVPHVAEIRYGIHFKKTDEYGLCCHFEEYERFCGSDATFKNERWLRTIRISYD